MSTTTTDPLMQALLDILADKVAERLKSMVAPPTNRLMTLKEAGMYISRSPGAVAQLVARGELSAIRSDRRIHLDKKDLDDWIERSRT